MTTSIRKTLRSPSLDKRSQELFSQFAVVFVKGINAETLNIDLGDVRVDFFEDAPLVKLDRQNRSMVFASRALDSIPKKLRKYLVIRHLAQFFESTNSERFWNLMGQFQPNYEIMERQLECFFSEDCRSLLKTDSINFVASADSDQESIAMHCQHVLEESEAHSDIGFNTKNGALVGAAS